jgi:glycosidase
VSGQTGLSGSLLELYRSLLSARKQHRSLREGSVDVLPFRGPLLGYIRRLNREEITVFLNFSGRPRRIPVPVNGTVLFRYPESDPEDRENRPDSLYAWGALGVINSK